MALCGTSDVSPGSIKANRIILLLSSLTGPKIYDPPVITPGNSSCICQRFSPFFFAKLLFTQTSCMLFFCLPEIVHFFLSSITGPAGWREVNKMMSQLLLPILRNHPALSNTFSMIMASGFWSENRPQNFVFCFA